MKTLAMTLLLTLTCLAGCDGADATADDLAEVDVPDVEPAPTPATPVSGTWVLGWLGDDLPCSFAYPVWTDLQLGDDGHFSARSGDVEVSSGTWSYDKIDLGEGDSTNAAYLAPAPRAYEPVVAELGLSSHDGRQMGGILTVTYAEETCSYLVRFDR